MSISSDFLLT